MSVEAVRFYEQFPRDVNILKNEIKESGFQHAALVCDGNRTWGSERIPQVGPKRAYKIGANRIEESALIACSLGIPFVSAWVLSPQNLEGRDPEEMLGLFDVLQETFAESAVPAMRDGGMGFKLVGSRELSEAAKQKLGMVGQQRFYETMGKLDKLQGPPSSSEGTTFTLLVNYGGEEEVDDVLTTAFDSGAPIQNIVDLKSRLALPDVNLLIRTGGEKNLRTNGVFALQMKKGQIVNPDQYWPDFRGVDFVRAMWQYFGKKHTYGK